MLNFVSVVLDLTDGEGNLVTFGSAQFVPSAILTDVPDGVIITQQPVQVPFTSGGSPSARLLATDNASPAPSGWTWGASFNIGGGITPYNFFLPAGPAPFTATSATPAVFTWTPTSAFTAAGLGTLPNGTGVQLSGGSLPTGFVAATTYYVVGSSGSTFQLAATPGGSALASTSTGSGNVTVTQYNLSSLTPAGSVGVSSPFMLVPAGTPSAGMVPIATGSGEASAWGSPGAAALTRAAVQTSNYTASAGQIVPVDTTSGAVTVTLPNAPAAGTLVAVKMVTQGGTNAVTVAAAGSDVFNKTGGPTTGTLTLISQGMLLEYNSGIWTVLADDLPLSQLDARYVELAGDLGGTTAAPKVVSVLGGRIPLASTSYIDLCTAWNNGSGPVAAVVPATPLTVTFNATTTATVTAGTAPASGAIIADLLPAGTTFTASGATLTLSAAATGSGSAPAWAGTDATTALQAALNYFNTQNTDGTVEFTKPGVYLINGAQQTGTSLGRSYSGQLLFPSRPLTSTSSLLGIRIKGSQPYPGMPGNGILENNGGVILLTSPGTGAVFDSIPGYGFGNIGTAITVTFEDITIRCPTNPQGSAINGTGFAGMLIRGGCCIDTISPGGAGSLTGSGYAVQWPGQGNMAMLHQSGELAIVGYPNGTNLGEHLLCDYLFIQACVTAVVASSSAHAMKLANVCIQACTYGIAPSGSTSHVSGLFDVGDSPPTAFLNDPTNLLYGDIQVAPVKYSATEVPGLGFPSNGGNNAVIRPFTRPQIMWPSDTFGRVNTLPATYTYGPGGTDRTGHIWTPTSAVTFPSAGGMQAAASSNPLTLLKYNAGRNNPSRVVRMKVTTGNTGYNVWLILAQVISGSNNKIYVQLNGGNVNIQKVLGNTPTTLATATGAVAANTAYTVDAYLSNPYTAAGAFTVTVFVNGTQVTTYTLTSGDAGGNSVTQLADAEQFYTEDGFGMFGDTSTLLTEWAVLPAS